MTWVVDEDEIAANYVRHTDLLQLTGRISQFLIRRQMGGNSGVCTTGSEGTDIRFEDFNAVTDLAAGSFCEVINKWSRMPDDPAAVEEKLVSCRPLRQGRTYNRLVLLPVNTASPCDRFWIDSVQNGAISIKRINSG